MGGEKLSSQHEQSTKWMEVFFLFFFKLMVKLIVRVFEYALTLFFLSFSINHVSLSKYISIHVFYLILKHGPVW